MVIRLECVHTHSPWRTLRNFDSAVFHHLNKPAALLFILLKSHESQQQLTLSHSLSFFFYTQTPFGPRTPVARRVRISPCVGHSCDQVASIGFTQEILSLKLTVGIFECLSLALFFFFTGHQTAFEGVDAVRQTNYRPPTARGRVPYGSSCKCAAPGKVSLNGINAQECHRLLVSWLAPLCQTVSFSLFFFYIRHSSQKEVKGCEWRSCRWLLLDLIFYFYFRQWRAKSCRFHLECGRLESLVKETECLILSPPLGPRGMNNWRLRLWASERAKVAASHHLPQPVFGTWLTFFWVCCPRWKSQVVVSERWDPQEANERASNPLERQ